MNVSYAHLWAMTLGLPGLGWNLPYPSRVPAGPIHSQHPEAWGMAWRWKRASVALSGFMGR